MLTDASSPSSGAARGNYRGSHGDFERLLVGRDDAGIFAGMRPFLIRWLVTTLALYVAVLLVPGIMFDEAQGAWRLILVALVFGGVNALLRPLLTVLTCPLILLTFGIFFLVVNALLLMATSWASLKLGLGFTVAGFWSACWGGLVVSIASTILFAITGRPKVVVRVQGGQSDR
jgi:putative membrane protein